MTPALAYFLAHLGACAPTPLALQSFDEADLHLAYTVEMVQDSSMLAEFWANDTMLLVVRHDLDEAVYCLDFAGPLRAPSL